MEPVGPVRRLPDQPCIADPISDAVDLRFTNGKRSIIPGA